MAVAFGLSSAGAFGRRARRAFSTSKAAFGNVVSFGRGDNGELGHIGPWEKSTTGAYAELLPRSVAALEGENVSAIDCGIEHSAAVTSDGRLFTWGKGDDHRLGHGVTQIIECPRLVEGLAGVNITKVACGDNHTLALSEDGAVFSWGFGGSFWSECPGAAENGRGESRPPCDFGFPFFPLLLSLVCWDAQNEFVLTKPVLGRFCPFPLLPNPPSSTPARSRCTHFLAPSIPGSGALGHGDSTTREFPTAIESLAEQGVKVVDIAAGEGFSVAIDDQGLVWSWGKGESGRLGNGGSSDQLEPAPVDFLEDVPCKQVACGMGHGMVVTDEGQLWAWGMNDQCQLGVSGGLQVDMYAMEEYPVQVEDGLEGLPIASVACGRGHTVAVAEDGTTFHWGSRTWEQPVRMTILDGQGAEQAACGKTYSLVRAADGKVYSWSKSGMMGRSSALGHGSKSYQAQPTLIEALVDTPVQAIAAGQTHCMALLR